MPKQRKLFFSEMIISIKLYLVLPATNGVSECSGSTLRRIRSAMRQEGSNHCMLLNVHNVKTDLINLLQIANEFPKLIMTKCKYLPCLVAVIM